MDSIDELRRDLAELRMLEKQSTRVKVKSTLLSHISQVEAQISKLLDSVDTNPLPPPIAVVQSDSTTTTLPPQRLTNYAWDQSEKFFKIYVNFPETKDKINEDQVSVEFGTNTVVMVIQNVNGRDWEFAMDDLLLDIIPEESKLKVKPDCILLMMKKEKEKLTWETVTRQEFIIKAKRDQETVKAMENKNPNAGLMSMMKKMYNDGDDDTKRKILKKAWMDEQQKKLALAGRK